MVIVYSQSKPDNDHEIALINPYHPSSSAWYSCFEDYKRYLTQLLNVK